MHDSVETSGQMINVMVGTAGHIDHGKTELVKLLTGCDTDRLKEEKQRGMSIELGFAPCALADNTRVGIVDVPGHERFIRNMVAGASSIDVVLLVVAADDGVMPQTREHLEVVELLGVKRGLIALTKIDIAEQASQSRAIEQIRELTRGTFLQDAAIAPVSSITGQGFDGFYEALSEVVNHTPGRNTQGVFRLPIERVFAVKGYGTVLTGVPASGEVQLGEQLELIHLRSSQETATQRISCRVRGLQVFGRDTERGLAGQCVAVNIAHVGSGQIGRGDALVEPGYFQQTEILTGRMKLLSRLKKRLAKRTPATLHVGTSERQCKMVLLDRSELAGGHCCPVQFLLDRPVLAGAGDRFVLRTHSPRMTIGGGVIVETRMTKRRKLYGTDLQQFQHRLQTLGNADATVEHLIKQAGAGGVSRNELQYAAGLKSAQLASCLENALAREAVKVFNQQKMFIHRETLKQLKVRLLELLESLHQANPNTALFSAEHLQSQLDVPGQLFEILANELLASGKVHGDNIQLGLPEAQGQLSGPDRQATQAVERVYLRCRARPPKKEELAQLSGQEEAAAGRGLDILIQQGTLLQISDKFAMHADVVGQARDVLVRYLREHGQLASAEYKDLIDSERKFAIALLDYFDRLGISIRRGSSRFLGGNPDASLRTLVSPDKISSRSASKRRYRK